MKHALSVCRQGLSKSAFLQRRGEIARGVLGVVAALLILSATVGRCQSNSCPAGFTGPGGTFEAPGYPTGTPITPGPALDTTLSFGLFQIYVNANFANLINPDLAHGYPGTYPGWHPGVTGGFSGVAGALTSPIVYDFATTIMRSAPHQRPYMPSGPGIPLGSGALSDLIFNYNQYLPGYPFIFSAASANTREVLTEIAHFTLALRAGPAQCGCDPASLPNVPCIIVPTTYNMVMAGQFNTDAPGLPSSLGMVQSLANFAASPHIGDPNYDYPAQSFFNVKVEVHLPPVPVTIGGQPTVSGAAFPTVGAFLYSDLAHPLTVQNPTMCSLPPSVVYTHTPQTLAVAIYFKSTCPNINPITGLPWWYANDLFGYLSLAGHGTLDPCAKTANVKLLVDAVLGPDNAAKSPAPIGLPLPNSDFPYPGMTFDSMHGTNDSGLSVDSINFALGPLAIFTRGLSFSFLQNPVSLPAFGTSKVYTNENTLGTGEFSTDGTNFFPGTMIGTIRIQISNTNAPLDGATFYRLQALQWDMAGDADFGPFYLRQSPTKSSPGTNIVVHQSSQGGVLAAASIDLNLQLSTDSVNYLAANKALHHTLVNPPCGAAGERLHVDYAGGNLIVSWWNSSYSLEGSSTLSPASWSPIVGISPITLSPTGPYKYFRLVCQ
jgi:hypothetical protein